jgi:hypothetical protein
MIENGFALTLLATLGVLAIGTALAVVRDVRSGLSAKHALFGAGVASEASGSRAWVLALLLTSVMSLLVLVLLRVRGMW